mgnify:FL=1
MSLKISMFCIHEAKLKLPVNFCFVFIVMLNSILDE